MGPPRGTVPYALCDSILSVTERVRAATKRLSCQSQTAGEHIVTPLWRFCISAAEYNFHKLLGYAMTKQSYKIRSTENSGPENNGPNRSETDRHDRKMSDQISRVEKCGTGKWEAGKCRTSNVNKEEPKTQCWKWGTTNARLENAKPKVQGLKCRTGWNCIPWTVFPVLYFPFPQFPILPFYLCISVLAFSISASSNILYFWFFILDIIGPAFSGVAFSAPAQSFVIVNVLATVVFCVCYFAAVYKRSRVYSPESTIYNDTAPADLCRNAVGRGHWGGTLRPSTDTRSQRRSPADLLNCRRRKKVMHEISVWEIIEQKTAIFFKCGLNEGIRKRRQRISFWVEA